MIRILCLLILGTVAGCNSNVTDEDATHKNPVNKTGEVGVCLFVKDTTPPLILDSLEITPILDNELIDSSQLIDSQTYNRFLYNTDFFKGTYQDYYWITVKKTKGFNENVYLINYAKIEGDNMTDAYLVIFSSNCEIRDGLHVASYNKFNKGNTLKTTRISKDTICIKTVITAEGDFDRDINRKHISKNEVVRKYFFYSDKQLFMRKD